MCAVPVISEICYTCINCLIVKKICLLKNQFIPDIYKDKCDKYSQRKLIQCLICGTHVIELPQHVFNQHKKTMTEYHIATRHLNNNSTTVRRRTLW